MKGTLGLLAICLMLTFCGGKNVNAPVPVGGYAGSVAPTSANVEARLAALQADVQKAISYFTDQDNSCRAPSQWFPAANCKLTATQRGTLSAGVYDAIDQTNAAIRAVDAWKAKPNNTTAAQMEAALAKARRVLDSLGVPTQTND